MLFFLVGGIQGYGNAIILFITAEGGTYDDQAVFSLATYAFNVKIFIAPLMDIVNIDSHST